MVLPQSPNCLPSKQAWAQRKKERPIEKVLPLLTVPSQKMASQAASRHQVRTFSCFGEKETGTSGFSKEGENADVLITTAPAFQLTGGVFQRLIKEVGVAGAVKQAAKGLQSLHPVKEFHLHAALIGHAEFRHRGQI